MQSQSASEEKSSEPVDESPRTEEEDQEPKKRPPVGGVSLFGNFDPKNVKLRSSQQGANSKRDSGKVSFSLSDEESVKVKKLLAQLNAVKHALSSRDSQDHVDQIRRQLSTDFNIELANNNNEVESVDEKPSAEAERAEIARLRAELEEVYPFMNGKLEVYVSN